MDFELGEEFKNEEVQNDEGVAEWLSQHPHIVKNQTPIKPAPLRRFNSTPASTFNNQRDEVLATAFEALKLRTLQDLPTFSGENVLDWPFFLSEFKRTTSKDINTPENLRRLQKAIVGKARTTVQPLLHNPNYVEKIIDMLEMNYGRIEWVMAKILQQLQFLPMVQEGDLDSMRSFYNQIFGSIHASESIGGEDYLVNPQLLLTLAEKLPPFSRNEWNRHKASLMKRKIKVTLQQFLEWLEGELETSFASFNPLQQKTRRLHDRKNVMAHQAIYNDNQTLTKCLHCKPKSILIYGIVINLKDCRSTTDD